MTRWLDVQEQRVWRSFIGASQRLDAHLARHMQASADISMADYAVLVSLSESADGRLRAFALGRALEWEKSRLSHHITRMERRGLVAREGCGTDRRGAYVVLSPAGRAALEAAAPPHVEAVRAAVFDRLTPEQAEQLRAACDAIIAGLAADPACREAQQEACQTAE